MIHRVLFVLHQVCDVRRGLGTFEQIRDERTVVTDRVDGDEDQIERLLLLDAVSDLRGDTRELLVVAVEADARVVVQTLDELLGEGRILRGSGASPPCFDRPGRR